MRGFIAGFSVEALASPPEPLLPFAPFASVRLIRPRRELGLAGLTALVSRFGVRRLDLDDAAGAVWGTQRRRRDRASALRSLEAFTHRGPIPTRPILAAMLRWIERAPIRSFGLPGGRIGDEGATALVAAGVVEAIGSVDLSGCDLTDAALVALSRSGGARPLALAAADNPDLSVDLDRLSAWRPIRSLDVGATATDPDHLLASPALQALRALGLARMTRPFGADHGRKLAQIPFRALTRLDLRGAEIDADSLGALCAAPCGERLISLALDGCPIGDAGIDALTSSEHPAAASPSSACRAAASPTAGSSASRRGLACAAS